MDYTPPSDIAALNLEATLPEPTKAKQFQSALRERNAQVEQMLQQRLQQQQQLQFQQQQQWEHWQWVCYWYPGKASFISQTAANMASYDSSSYIWAKYPEAARIQWREMQQQRTQAQERKLLSQLQGT